MNHSTRPVHLKALHAAPAAGFDEPFEMLSACHERVERMLRLMERLAAHLANAGADAQAAAAARDVMRYFDVAGPAHHEDEERHILPALAAAGQAPLAEQLHAEHVAMADGWRAVRADLAEVAARRWDEARGSPVRDRWLAFAAGYRAHIALPESAA